MFKKAMLAKTIAYLSTGVVVSAASIPSASASTTYYNTQNAFESNIVTDGSGQDGYSAPDSTYWTSGATPFNATAPFAHWAVEVTAAGDVMNISSQDAHDQFGIWADLDTAKGAWFDGAQGWAHNTDVGLFKSLVDTNVTIFATAVQAPGSTDTWTNFGISVFNGMSAENTWDHHGKWNCPACDPAMPFEQDNPVSSSGLTYLTHDDTVDSVNGITFHAAAGQIYSILLGGNSGGSNFNPKAGYSLNIVTSPVPVPAAVWLFGSALMGLVSMQRRRLKL